MSVKVSILYILVQVKKETLTFDQQNQLKTVIFLLLSNLNENSKTSSISNPEQKM